MTPEIQQRLQSLRYRIAGGETISIEEMRDAVALQRSGRLSAVTASDTARRKKAIAAVPNADDMLAELGDDM